MPHRVQQPPMHWLQTVARVRQRTADDRRNRVREIARGNGVAERNILDDPAVGLLRHPYRLAFGELRPPRPISSTSRRRAAAAPGLLTVHMPQQEVPTQRQTVCDCLAPSLCGVADQELGQAEKPVAPQRPGCGGDGTTRARRYVGKIAGRPGRRTRSEIQPETELRQQLNLPTDIAGGPSGVGFDRREQLGQRVVEGRHRLALRQRRFGHRAAAVIAVSRDRSASTLGASTRRGSQFITPR